MVFSMSMGLIITHLWRCTMSDDTDRARPFTDPLRRWPSSKAFRLIAKFREEKDGLVPTNQSNPSG